MELVEIVLCIFALIVVVLGLMLLHEKGKTNALKRIARFNGLEQEIGQVVITKFTAEPLKKDHKLVSCPSYDKTSSACKGCDHSTPHEHTRECELWNCQTVVRIHTPKYHLKKDLNS